MDVALRRLQSQDIDQVIEIEREAFSPLWVRTPFKRELNNRYARYLVAYFPDAEGEDSAPEPEPAAPPDPSLWGKVVKTVQGVVKRDGDAKAPSSDMAGYVGIWFQGNEAHITEIAVRESLRGNGIGELLLIGSVRAAIERGSSVVTLEVRVSNFVAQRLYEKYGFKTAGIRKGYYTDNREDALIMTTSPIHSANYRSSFDELQRKYLARWGPINIDD